MAEDQPNLAGPVLAQGVALAQFLDGGKFIVFFFFSSRRRHTRLVSDWSSDVCSSDLSFAGAPSASPRTTYKRVIEAYRVPLILFHPGGKLPKVNPQRIVQHVDIGPSILDFLGLDTARLLPFGHSVFDPAFDGLAFSQLNGNYWIAEKKHFLEYHVHGGRKLFELSRPDAPVTDKPEIEERLEKKS